MSLNALLSSSTMYEESVVRQLFLECTEIFTKRKTADKKMPQ